MNEGQIVAEKILKIPFGQLTTVRIVCQRENCGGAIEIPVARLEALVGEVQCPSCGHGLPVKNIGAVGGWKALGMALRNLAEHEHFRMEFVLTVPE